MHVQISISLRLFLSRLSLHIPFSLLLPLLEVYHSNTLYPGKGEEKCIQSFGGEHEGKRQIGRPKRRWDGDIKTGPKGT